MARSSLVDDTATALLDRIISGEFPEGSTLPSQEQLARQLEVSRPTAREAIKILQQQGVLRVEHGNGTFVNPTASWTDIEVITKLLAADGQGGDVPEQVIEVRRIIEVAAAGLCASRCTPETLEDLGRHLAAMELAADQSDLDSFVDNDIAFHDVILRGGQNRFLAAVFDPMRTTLRRARTQTSWFPEIRQHAIAHHRDVLKAVASGNPERASAAMSAHLDQTRDDLLSHVPA